jgi:hypothetical protein
VRGRAAAAVPVTGVVAVGAVLCGAFALQVTQWTVMSDELLYRKLSEGIAGSLTLTPEIHGDRTEYPTVLYPLLMAPVFGLFDATSAFRVAHGLNALVMASAAVPAFLLMRRLVASRAIAVLVALLTILVPWMAFSTVLLTEVLGYPAFLWALLAAQRTLAEPSPRRDAVAAGVIVVATAARPQFLVLGPVLVLAAVAHTVGLALAAPGDERRLRAVRRASARAARAHRLGIGFIAATVLALPLVRTLLGPYGDQLGAQLVPPGTAAHAVDQLAVIAVGCGLVPLVVGLAWAAAMLVRPASKEAHAFAVLGLVSIPALIAVAASFDLRSGGGILFDRYAFYVAPVMLIAMGAGLADVRRTSFGLPLGAGVAVITVLSYDFVVYALPWFVSPASVFHQVMDGRADQLGLDPEIILAAVAILAALVVAVCGRLARLSPAIVVGVPLTIFLLVQSVYVMRHLGIDAQPAALDRGQTWVDDAVGEDAIVASVPGAIAQEGTGTAPYWDLEFWNASVARQLSYENTQAHHTELGSGQLGVNPADGSLTLSEPVRHLVVPAADRRFKPAGQSVAAYAGLELIALEPRPRAAWVIRGTDGEAGWVDAGGLGTVDVYGDPARAQRVELTLVPPPGQAGSRRVSIRDGARRTVASVVAGRQQEVAVTVCLRAARHRLAVRFDGATRLPSGRAVGGAILTARTSTAGACRR